MNSEIKKTGLRDLTKESKITTVSVEQESEKIRFLISYVNILSF